VVLTVVFLGEPGSVNSLPFLTPLGLG